MHCLVPRERRILFWITWTCTESFLLTYMLVLQCKWILSQSNGTKQFACPFAWKCQKIFDLLSNHPFLTSSKIKSILRLTFCVVLITSVIYRSNSGKFIENLTGTLGYVFENTDAVMLFQARSQFLSENNGRNWTQNMTSPSARNPWLYCLAWA